MKKWLPGNPPLLLSLAGNLLLLMLLCWRQPPAAGMPAATGRKNDPTAEAPPKTPQPSGGGTAQAQISAAETSKKAASTSFHWSQIDAEDFPTYVRNLRGIGCPEEVVKDLIRDELEAIHEESLLQARRMVPAARAREAEAAILEKLEQQYVTIIDGKVQGTASHATGGNAPVTSSYAANGRAGMHAAASARTAATRQIPPQIPVSYAFGSDPKGWLAGDSTAAQLVNSPVTTQMSPSEQSALADLRTNFQDGMTTVAAKHPPQSAEYRKAWDDAQSMNDENFRVLFGVEAFVQAQINASQERLASLQPAAK